MSVGEINDDARQRAVMRMRMKMKTKKLGEG